MILTPKTFLVMGLNVVHQNVLIKEQIITIVTGKSTKETRFRALFGVSSDVCSHVWEYIVTLNPTTMAKTKPEHLLWCLLFLKTYNSEAVLSTVVGVTEKTFRLWVWRLIAVISCLYVRLVSIMLRLHHDFHWYCCILFSVTH
jgi:hypothetical protein